MTQRQANELLMEQWFRLHKTPSERWAEECKRLAPFDTLDEYLSAVSVEHFGEDVLNNFRPHRSVKAKIETLQSKALMLLRSEFRK